MLRRKFLRKYDSVQNTRVSSCHENKPSTSKASFSKYCRTLRMTGSDAGIAESVRNEGICCGDHKVQVFRIRKQKLAEKRCAETWTVRSKKWKFERNWYKLRCVTLVFILMIAQLPKDAMAVRAKNSNSEFCEQYNVPLPAVVSSSRLSLSSQLLLSSLSSSSALSLFTRQCRCAPDWRLHFCSHVSHYKSLLAVPERHWQEEEQLPTVCICRCLCCFNQPGAFCNQLQCRNGEPVFDLHANTTCICHPPDFYPYSICTHQNAVVFEPEKVSSAYD
ncbi:unnamed protein product [Gongylonema pulchrum]|uniref:TIL domain-containing protein n=1 Tax=Gongylonema pulchrum TaxID=637853 RepID=A0A183CY22_9BILA|nr:unnamed protein product [Gongylonema pulchrum]